MSVSLTKSDGCGKNNDCSALGPGLRYFESHEQPLLLRRVANWSCKIQADSGPQPKKHGGVIGQEGHVTVTSPVQMKIH